MLSRATIALILTLTATLLTAPGCARKRDPKFSQGQGERLDAIEIYDGKEFKLRTGDQISSSYTTRSGNLSISPSLEGEMSNFGIVSIDTDARLLGSVAFRGRTHHDYVIRYQLADKYLKIYKIAPKADIPYQEHPYAEQLPDGRLAVPLVGYNVTYFQVEQRRNSDGDLTSELVPIKERVRTSNATHVEVDFNSRALFEALRKIDVFPSGLFDGEWYYSETIIDTSEDNKDEIGSSRNEDINQQDATKIKFVRSNNLVRGVNLNIDERLNRDDEVHLTPAIEIPVRWVEYRAVRAGNGTGLKEEESDEKPWNARPYVEVNFEATSTRTFPNTRRSDSESKLVDLEIDRGFFSFTHFKPTQGIRVKYAFLKAGDRGYAPRRYFESDYEKFGFFTNLKPVVRNWEIYRPGDLEQHLRINRFNPERDIIYHFAASSPRAYRETGRQAVAAWNEAFKKAGMSIEMKLDETRDVQLGDLRYNTINLIDSLSGAGGLLGYGPSVTDPNSGERIAATSNVHIASARTGIIRSIRTFIMAETGQIEGIQPGELTGMPANAVLSETITTGPAREVELFSRDADRNSTLKKYSVTPQPLTEKKTCSNHIAGNAPAKEIAAQCDEVLGFIRDVRAGRARPDDAAERNVLLSCAEKLLPRELVSVLVHEIGHNIGLRHNFLASTDKANFYTAAETGTDDVVPSTSIMEYSPPDQTRLPIPGKYDIAALKYGYAGKLELADGRALTLNPNLNIDQNLQRQSASGASLTRKNYEFCTDGEAYYYWTRPMCRIHDAGTTPEEAVDYLIQSFWNSYRLENFLYGRLRNQYPADVYQPLLAFNRASRYLRPMKRYYDEWRFMLAQRLALGQEHLEHLDAPAMQALIAQIQSEPNSPIAQYQRAADKAYRFLKELAFVPNRYCVMKTGSEISQVLEFSRVRDQVYRNRNQAISSCSDAAVAAEFKADAVTGSGYQLSDVRFSMAPEDLTEPYDIVGIELDRLNAYLMLVQRANTSLKSDSMRFFPNFVDEPAYRRDLEQATFERLAVGASFPFEGKTLRLPRFLMEKDLLTTQQRLLLSGIRVPGKSQVNGDRMEPYYVHLTQNPEEVRQAYASLRTGTGYLTAMQESNAAAAAFIGRIKTLTRMAQPAAPIEDYNALIAALQGLPSQADLPDPTIGQFLESFASIEAALSGLPNAQAVFNTLRAGSPALKDAIALIQAIESSQPDLLNANATDPARQQKVSELSLPGGTKPYPLYREHFAGVDVQIRAIAQQLQTQAHTYEKDRLDFEAQQNLLFEILINQSNAR